MTAMREEIGQQAQVVAAMAADAAPFEAAAAEARAAGARFVLYAARGTSDNAAVYGKYLATIAAGLPCGLAVPSAATVYRARVDLSDCLVIGISQSGETPDVAEYVARARSAGAFTLAVTNERDSTLAGVAHRALVTGAGVERAVAATKTYTSQLAALALFWSAWTGQPDVAEALRGEIPQAMDAALALEELVAGIAARLSHADRLLVTGRGYNYSTALEIALKVEETCYLPALPYSAADVRHGPIAIVEPRYPVVLLALSGATYEGMLELHGDLRSRGAQIFVITDGDDEFGGAEAVLRLPAAPESLSPLVAVVPGQLFALRLSLARGLDPDRPRGLSKVTHTY